ncbi:MAG TPA: histidine kinase [Prolixibacteraceae bacterium]|nr:histidine kinase [Prolixibacteraceae bacterium]
MMNNKAEENIPVPFLRWRGFTIRIFLITILPLLVIILGIVFLSQFLHLQEMRSMVGDRNLRTVRLASELVQEQLQQKNDLLLVIIPVISTDPLSIPEINLFDGGIAIFDISQNRIIGQNSRFLIEQIPREIVQNWSELSNGEVSAPQLILNKELTSLSIIASPLSGSNYLIAAYNHEDLLKRSLAGLIASQAVTILVIDQHQNILYQIGNFPANENSSTHSGVAEALAGESGVNYINLSDNEHVVTFTPVLLSNWAIILEETWKSIATPLVNTTFYTPLILIPLLIVAVVALWFGANQIIRPLQKLQQRSQSIGKGDFEQIREPVGGIEEIRHLQQQLIQVSGELQAAQINLHHYIGAITDGIENERRNLARELHDDTLQSLIALQQHVQMASLHINSDTANSGLQIKELRGLLQKSIVNLRRLVRGLRPAYLDDLGLVSALEMLVNETNKTFPHHIKLEINGDESRLNSEVELAFYRIAQESLSNVVRHSQASEVIVNLRYEKNLITLEIQDNGIGFDFPDRTESFAASSHFGLIGMKERAELVDAQLTIQTYPRKGTTVVLMYLISSG